MQNIIIEARLCNHYSSGKAVSTVYSEHVRVALGVQHAMHMCHIAICVLPGLQYFSTYLINGTISEKKKLMNTEYVIWFSVQLLSEKFLTLRRTEGNSIKSAHRSACKVPVILARFH